MNENMRVCNLKSNIEYDNDFFSFLLDLYFKGRNLWMFKSLFIYNFK